MQEIREATDWETGGLGLEEIEERLESALLSDGGVGTMETCLWACECFSIFRRAEIANL